jgi:hypothetical protein
MPISTRRGIAGDRFCGGGGGKVIAVPPDRRLRWYSANASRMTFSASISVSNVSDLYPVLPYIVWFPETDHGWFLTSDLGEML